MEVLQMTLVDGEFEVSRLPNAFDILFSVATFTWTTLFAMSGLPYWPCSLEFILGRDYEFSNLLV